jgi:hypothetical protein
LKPIGHGVVNPPLDVQKYLPASVDSENYWHYEDQKEIDLYEAMLHAADLPTTKVGKSDGEGTFAGTRGNDKVAPFVDLHITAIRSAQVGPSRHSCWSIN